LRGSSLCFPCCFRLATSLHLRLLLFVRTLSLVCLSACPFVLCLCIGLRAGFAPRLGFFHVLRSAVKKMSQIFKFSTRQVNHFRRQLHQFLTPPVRLSSSSQSVAAPVSDCTRMLPLPVLPFAGHLPFTAPVGPKSVRCCTSRSPNQTSPQPISHRPDSATAFSPAANWTGS
jgi:hypothetical protein